MSGSLSSLGHIPADVGVQARVRRERKDYYRKEMSVTSFHVSLFKANFLVMATLYVVSDFLPTADIESEPS